MSWIKPDSNLRILSGIRLDSDVNYSIWWDSGESAQEDYFISHTQYVLNEFTYQRKNRGSVKVPLSVEDLTGCNYLMYRNDKYENKWFYAFIKDIDYVNDGCTAVNFEIDPVQTWFFEMRRQNSYVIRCHSGSDEIGENVLPEPVELGEYVTDYVHALITDESQDPSQIACIAAICDTDEKFSTARMDNIFTASDLYAFSNTDAGQTALLNLLNKYIQKPDAIVQIYMVPYMIIRNYCNTGEPIPTYTGQEYTITGSTLTGNEGLGLDKYIPKNKKLYTYPYNYYLITNGETAMDLRYEFFDDLTPVFDVYGNISYPPSLTLRPMKYGQIDASRYTTPANLSHTQSLSLRDYPQCSVACDSFATWAAQNVVSNTIGVVGTVASVVSQAASLNPIGAITTGITAAAEAAEATYTASIQPDQCCGSTSVNSECAHGRYTFWGGRCCIQSNYAEMIDSFFTQFGYAQNRIMGISPLDRPSFYHVQTGNMNVYGMIPDDDRKQINQKFNQGITFWRNPDQIGNFEVDNSV